MGGRLPWRRSGARSGDRAGARRPVVAALLNLGGIGLGYAYLGSWLRAALNVAGTAAIAGGALFASGDRIAPAWALAFAAWVAVTSWDAYRRGRGDAPRARAVPVAVALAVLVGEVAGLWTYRSSGDGALAAGWDAHRAGDCRVALEHYDGVRSPHQLTFSGAVASARERARECARLEAARAARTRDEFDAAVSRYRAFLADHGNGVLGSFARAEAAATYVAWARALARDADYRTAISKLAIVRDDFAGTPGATRAAELTVSMRAAWERAYQRRLDTAQRKVDTAFARLRSAAVLPKLERWFGTADGFFDGAGERLLGFDPPPAVAAAHDDVAASLDAFDSLLSDTAQDVGGSNAYCAAPSVLAHLRAADDGRRLRAGAAALRRRGFDFAVPALERARMRDRRLATGDYVVPKGGSGANTLTLENQLGVDAVFALTLGSKEPHTAVYVRAREEFTITGMANGSFTPYYTTGRDWDSGLDVFTRSCAFTKGKDEMNLTSDATSYTVGTLTLLRRDDPKGKRTAPLDPGSFPNL
ncbi:MAG TPA: hypothetical protein VHJ34_10115 [Actinomycetota bacterium]|nr:hypothetical protein [Actinomycetota bacterium]